MREVLLVSMRCGRIQAAMLQVQAEGRSEVKEKTEVELLTVEYIEEVMGAGGARLMSAADLATFISELVLNNFEEPMRSRLRSIALNTAHLCLLPERCRVGIDAETVARLKEVLGR